MLNNLRGSLQPHLEKIGKGFASTGISPNGWSCIGLVFAFASSIVYGFNIEFSLIIGGVILLPKILLLIVCNLQVAKM